jgi:hypothetical protein
MAHLAGMLRLHVGEAAAFWCFLRFMAGEKVQFRRLYANNFAGLNALNVAWEQIFAKRYEKIAARLTASQMISQFCTTPWFLTAFLELELPPGLRLAVFGRCAAFGCRALLSFGLVIISCLKDALLTADCRHALMLLQNPDKEQFKDWRAVIGEYDKLWISEKNYESLFTKAGLKPFT